MRALELIGAVFVGLMIAIGVYHFLRSWALRNYPKPIPRRKK